MSDAPWLGEMSAEERVDRFLGRQNIVIESVDPLSRLNLNVSPFRENMTAMIRDAEARARAAALDEAAQLVEERYDLDIAAARIRGLK